LLHSWFICRLTYRTLPPFLDATGICLSFLCMAIPDGWCFSCCQDFREYEEWKDKGRSVTATKKCLLWENILEQTYLAFFLYLLNHVVYLYMVWPDDSSLLGLHDHLNKYVNTLYIMCDLYSMVLGFYSVVVTNSEELYRFKNGPLWCFLKASFKNKHWTVWNNLLDGFMEINSELQKLEMVTLWKTGKYLTNYNMHSTVH
jgi:hypothetical protein